MKTNLPNREMSDYPLEEGEAASGGRIPPHSFEAEQSVLGAVLIDNEALYSVLEVVSEDDFYRAAHRRLFAEMIALSERREPIDVLTLSSALRKSGGLDEVGGVEYLSHLVDIVPTAANAQYYARLIKEKSLRRKLIHAASDIASEAFSGDQDIDDFIDAVEQRIFRVSEAKTHASFAHVSAVVKDSVKRIEQLYVNKQAVTGVPSGFRDLDEMTSGFQPSDLVIIAGRPSMGKTALALSMAKHVAIDAGLRVAFFSLEMSKEQIVMRLLSSEAKVDNSRVRSGKLGESDFPRLVDAASTIAQAEIYVDDTPALSVLEMRAKARRLHREHALSLIFVDYLQLMRGSLRSPERREQEISEISRSLKAMAKELSLPVVALSQLNRGVETRQDKRPMMADLRESGAIEQDADIICFVYRDEAYNKDSEQKGIAELIVAKHRNGPVGTVRLGFQDKYTLFVDLEEEHDFDFLGEDFRAAEEEEFI